MPVGCCFAWNDPSRPLLPVFFSPCKKNYPATSWICYSNTPSYPIDRIYPAKQRHWKKSVEACSEVRQRVSTILSYTLANPWRFNIHVQDQPWSSGIPHGVHVHTPNSKGLRGHAYKFHQQRCCNRRRQYAFTIRAAPSWNKLPTKIVNASSVKSFKTLLGAH